MDMNGREHRYECGEAHESSIKAHEFVTKFSMQHTIVLCFMKSPNEAHIE